MRFKSVLGAFIFILLASLIALIVYVQSKSFGELVTKIVTDLSQKKLSTSVEVNSLSISLLPPGFVLNKITVKKEFAPDEFLQAQFGTVGFFIKLLEIEEKKLTFGEIKVTDSYLEYTGPEKNEELKEIDQKLVERVFLAVEDLPLRVDTLLLENSRVFINQDLLEIRRLKLFKEKDSFTARFHLSNLHPIAEEDLYLDEVWGDAKISRNDIQIERLKAQHDVHTLLLKGKISNYPQLKKSSISLVGEAQLHLGSLDNEFSLPEFVKIKKGIGKFAFNVSYQGGEVSAKTQFHVDELRSNFAYANDLRGSLSFDQNQIILQQANLNFKEEKVKLLAPILLYDLDSGNYLNRPIELKLENFSLNNALRILGDNLRPLKGRMTGELKIVREKNRYSFLPQEEFTVRDLGFVVNEDENAQKIIMIRKALLSDSKFELKDNEFELATTAILPGSRLKVTGLINKSQVFFEVPEAPVNLEDFGNIANLDIKGVGTLALKVAGPLDHTIISLKGRTRGFEILGYKLDESEMNLAVDLANREVLINKMESQIGKTQLSGTGSVNYGNAEIALGITTTETNFSDLSLILTPVFKDLTFLPEDLSFKAKVDVDIFGKYRFEDLKIKSRVNFTEFLAYGEMITAGSFQVALLNKGLSFNKLLAQKNQGTLAGDFTIDLKDKIFNLDYNWRDLELSSLNIAKWIGVNLDGKLNGKISGGGKLTDYILNFENKTTETKSPTYDFADSLVTLKIMKERIQGKMNILGEVIKSSFNISLIEGLASDIHLKFKAPDLKPILVAFFGQHIYGENFTGSIDFEGSTKFDDGFLHLDLTGILKELNFNHPEFNVNYSSTKPQFVVKDSSIKSWNLNIQSTPLFLQTSGEGEFGNRVSLVHQVHFDSRLLDILLEPVLSAEGSLQNIIRLNGNKSHFDFVLSSRADGVDLSIQNLPVRINDLKYIVEYADRKLQIQNFSSSLDSGIVSAKGDIYFDGLQPDVNLKFNLDKAEIPILGKSSMNVSGEGIVLGNNFPYNMSGEILINKAQVVNELNEFNTKSASFSQVRFLPRNQESSLGKMFNLNLNVKSENPIRISNSLMDVALIGEVRLLGSTSRLRAEGRLRSPVNTSRIFFKNNEYQISNADINFSPKKAITNPDFDIKAVTFISSYKIFPKAYGDLERFSFDLSSEPALPRNSILSLIAFGYTDEIQSSLFARDQQSLTEVGVGSFVFDRFKISDILNKQFGLQVNLGTVLEQSENDSLLSGRSQDGGTQTGAFGRTRSATKIELKKRLDEAMTLSVSSTMGGSIGQRQSMNLNYGFSNNVQFEGVYEIRTNDEGDAEVFDSIGGDIKFRRTFK